MANPTIPHRNRAAASKTNKRAWPCSPLLRARVSTSILLIRPQPSVQDVTLCGGSQIHIQRKEGKKRIVSVHYLHRHKRTWLSGGNGDTGHDDRSPRDLNPAPRRPAAGKRRGIEPG